MTSVLQRRGQILMYAGVALASLYTGLLIVQSQAAMAMSLLALLALAGLIVLLNMPSAWVFLGWLFLAPLFQIAADAHSLGKTLTWALYIAPALVLVILTLIRRRDVHDSSPIDLLPLAYVGCVTLSILFTTDMLQADPTVAVKSIFTLVALGPIVYYFLTRGPGVDIPASHIFVVLAAASLVQGVFALIETSTGWTLWGGSGWFTETDGWRATATLDNPGVLGMLLGASIVFAIAVLTWGGPRRLRPLSWVVLVVCTPALFVTLTRGPVVATALAVVLVLLLGHARLLGVATLIAAAVLVFALLPALQKSDLYGERVAQSATVDIRVAIQDISLQLAAQKPLLGWGYGSFDRIKEASGLLAEGIPVASVLATTSHNTFLTILVELGALGILLFLTPFLVFSYRSIARPPPTADRWLLAAALGSLVVVFLTGSTLDFRFFSFGLMLPFLYLAIVRRMIATEGGPAASVNPARR